MTAEEAAFLRTICDSPDDDAPRLVYADWLDEHDRHARAAFIRSQCAMANLPEWDRRWWEVYNRMEWTSSPNDRFQSIPPSVSAIGGANARHGRGFVQELPLTDVTPFLSTADAVFRDVPLQALDLHRPSPAHIAALADSPHLARLRKLRTSLGYLDAEPLCRLGESPHAIGLRSLTIQFGGITVAGVRALGASPLFTRLIDVDLSENHFEHRIIEPFIESARALPGPIALRRLYLSKNSLCAGPAAQLLASPATANLEELHLYGNPLHGPGCQAIANAANLRNLRVLRLNGVDPTVPGVRALTQSPHLSGLRWLDLRNNQLGPVTAKAIAASTTLRGLTVLELGHNRIADNGAKALAASANSSSLVVLDLSGCGVTDVGAMALAESPHLGNLLFLRLYDNRLSDAAKASLRKRFGEPTRLLL